jgi:hypothetical protein
MGYMASMLSVRRLQRTNRSAGRTQSGCREAIRAHLELVFSRRWKSIGGIRGAPAKLLNQGSNSSRCCRGEAIRVDGNNRLRIGARVLLAGAGTLALWTLPSIALADPSLPDASAPVDAASSAASSAEGTVDSAASVADDLVGSVSNEAAGAGDSAISTAEATAEAASDAAGTASATASQAGGGSVGTSAPEAAASSGSSASSPTGSPGDGGSISAPAGNPAASTEGERGRVVSRYDGGSPRRGAHDDAMRSEGGRNPGGKQGAQKSHDTPREAEDGRRVGDLSALVQSGQDIGDSATVSVVTNPNPSDDPPLFDDLPITGFEASVLFAVGAGLASLGLAALSYARERSAGSGRPRLS